MIAGKALPTNPETRIAINMKVIPNVPDHSATTDPFPQQESEMPLIRYLFATSILVCANATMAADAQPAETPSQALARVMDASRLPLAIELGSLSGAGADKMIEAARHAQFILVGEDHGFVEVPRFVLGLRKALGKDAPDNLVIETGPLAAARLAEAARSDTLSTLSARYPAEIPFFDWNDDGAMALAFQQNKSANVLWGIDQEFILSTRMNFERLSQLHPDAVVVAAYVKRAQEAEAKMLAEHDPSAALLPQLQAEDFAALRAAVKSHTGSESTSIIDELAESAEIYRSQGSDGNASNHQRSLLMKRHFMAHFDAANRHASAPVRAMFRIGAYHAGRGLNPINQYDLGNLASELAASRGLSSVHILVLAAGGTVNKWLPFVEEKAARASPYDAKMELESVHAVPFIEHALKNQWSVFDLHAFRSELAARKEGGAGFEQLVFAYDYVVMVPEGHAAVGYRD